MHKFKRILVFISSALNLLYRDSVFIGGKVKVRLTFIKIIKCLIFSHRTN